MLEQEQVLTALNFSDSMNASSQSQDQSNAPSFTHGLLGGGLLGLLLGRHWGALTTEANERNTRRAATETTYEHEVLQHRHPRSRSPLPHTFESERKQPTSVAYARTERR